MSSLWDTLKEEKDKEKDVMSSLWDTLKEKKDKEI